LFRSKPRTSVCEHIAALDRTCLRGRRQGLDLEVFAGRQGLQADYRRTGRLADDHRCPAAREAFVEADGDIARRTDQDGRERQSMATEFRQAKAAGGRFARLADAFAFSRAAAACGRGAAPREDAAFGADIDAEPFRDANGSELLLALSALEPFLRPG